MSQSDDNNVTVQNKLISINDMLLRDTIVKVNNKNLYLISEILLLISTTLSEYSHVNQ
jgi:hypothetical protein